MIKRFSDMSILVRIALLALVPAMALLGVGLVQVVDRRAVAKDAGRVAEVVASAPVISQLVHELQKERGTSAGFVGSKGKSFADTIGDRRAETDAAFAAFEKLMPGVDADRRCRPSANPMRMPPRRWPGFRRPAPVLAASPGVPDVAATTRR
ncbi:MAG: nitrate- and nitrite sensing domain-containing protein [Hyphomicrobiales bacterium]